MQTRRIGDLETSAIGLGSMWFSFQDEPDDAVSIRAIHASLDAGVRLIDTALCYTNPAVPEAAIDAATGIRLSHNEDIVRRALANHLLRDEVLVATKGAHHMVDWTDFPKDGRPESIKAHCELSLRTLGVEAIGLYQMHWPDLDVPIVESLGAFADLQREGKVRMVGVSNFSIDQIEQARSVVDVVSVQNRFSPLHQEDRSVLEHCAANGIAYLSYSPLGGATVAKTLGELLPAFQQVADERGVTVPQVVLAWQLEQAPNVIPIPGSRRSEALVECAQAAELTLTPEDLALLDA